MARTTTTMTDKEIVDALNTLIETDHDAIGAYNSAINGLEDEPEIRGRFVEFRGDHERHIRELSPFVRQFGGDPEKRPGIAGLLRKGMTEVSKAGGVAGILRAMVSNEEATSSTYQDAANKPFPPEILRVVESGLSDERRHLAYCRQAYENFSRRK